MHGKDLDVEDLVILHQPNGRYALYNTSMRDFLLINAISPEEIKGYLQMAGADILVYSDEDPYFWQCIEEYKAHLGVLGETCHAQGNMPKEQEGKRDTETGPGGRTS